uniref:Uncharacterized protein n=1 Tax=Pseudictyota dubia TaxID=2749911 RepID=A0A7R9VVC0_9STRA
MLVCRNCHESKLRLSMHASVTIESNSSSAESRVESSETSGGESTAVLWGSDFGSIFLVLLRKIESILQPRLFFTISNSTGAQLMVTPRALDAASLRHFEEAGSLPDTAGW